MYNIYPKVKKITYIDDCFNYEKLSIFLSDKKVNAFIELIKELKIEVVSSLEKANILLENDSALGEEAYMIDCDSLGIKITTSTNRGLYYAFITLKQIISGNSLKCFKLFDEPDLKVRGLMIDISRNKVYTVETIKKIIDMMSNLKMNHLELYVEGFSFEFECFEKYLTEEGYITKEEFKELEKYANSKFVDLVPNANGFGHMDSFLEKEEFKSLAECEDGIFLWGRNRKASTLNPLDEGSIELVRKIYDEMIPISNSKYFNMNFDEPFELGKGKSKIECDEKGIGNVYIDYTLKAYELVKMYNKTPLIWMDVLLKHPDLLYRLPKDMIFVDWGYDSFYSFEKHFKKLKELNTSFIAAPGTSSWCSFLGRTEESFETIRNACKASIDYGGLGVLLTDWGDFGHLQYLPISYGPICYCALLAWRYSEGEYREIKHMLNKFIFKDENEIIGDCLLDLGRYNRLEHRYIGNGTEAFYTFMWACHANGEENSIEYFLSRVKNNLFDYNHYELFEDFFDSKLCELNKCKLMCDEKDLVLDEIKESINMIRLIHKLMIAFCKDVDLKKRISLLDDVISKKEILFKERKRLWLERGKISGFAESFNHIVEFIEFANKTREYLIRGEHYEIKV